jgi:hypothetical protein
MIIDVFNWLIAHPGHDPKLTSPKQNKMKSL